MDPSLSNLAPPPPQPAVQYPPFIPFFPPPAAAPNGIPNFQGPIPNLNPAGVIPRVPENVYSPSYTEMIYSAIAALNEPDGSSKIAIAKYIERAFSDLPPTHSALLTHHLKRMKNDGSIILVKKSYKLPNPRSDGVVGHINVAAPPPSVGPKKGRGRPPKPKPDGISVTPPPVQVPQPTNGPVQLPQPTNGPVFAPQPVSEPINNVNGPAAAAFQPITNPSTVVKRGRGRPPKSGLLGPKKIPGPGRVARPRKPKSVYSPSPFKRGRGRPAKPSVQAPPPATTQVPAQGQLFDVGVTGPSIVARTRGRPKRTASSAAVGGVASGGGVGAVVSGKRRGRPPRAGSIASTLKRKNTAGRGRPVGRPKKNSSNVRGAAEHVVYEDMKRKFEFFQSKIVEAVLALKPLFNSQSSINAIAALQDLEELAAMDVNDPLVEEPEPQPMAPQNQPPPMVPQNQPPQPPPGVELLPYPFFHQSRLQCMQAKPFNPNGQVL